MWNLERFLKSEMMEKIREPIRHNEGDLRAGEGKGQVNMGFKINYITCMCETHYFFPQKQQRKYLEEPVLQYRDQDTGRRNPRPKPRSH